jgi:hypothetical protein
MRGVAKAALYAGFLLGLTLPARVFADQHQDWMLAAGENGTFMNLDFIVGALQAGLEHRIPLYGGANQFTMRGSALAALPFGSSQIDADLRIVNLTIGMSGGYQSIWRNQTFALGEPMDRKERRDRESSGAFNDDKFGFWEGRAGLAFPFNDYVLLVHNTSWHISGAEKRSFDNAIGVIDDGRWVRTKFQLFFKYKNIGGFAPTFEVLNFPLDHDWKTQYDWGFMLIARAGLVQRDDFIAWEMMFHTGPVFGGGFDNRDNYGAALFRAPLTFLLVYRSVINLWSPDWDKH